MMRTKQFHSFPSGLMANICVVFLLILNCCTSSKQYPCPDDHGFFSEDPCWPEDSSTYKNQNVTDLSSGISKELPAHSVKLEYPDSLYFLLQDDSGIASCDRKNLKIRFNRIPSIGDTVYSEDIGITGYRWLTSMEGEECGTLTKQENGHAWLTKIYDKKVADDYGPSHGQEILYKYQCDWEAKTLRGDLVYSRKFIHH